MITRCAYCGFVSQENDLFVGVDREGKTVILCVDGGACLRRKMAKDGVKLLPHPKNPPVVVPGWDDGTWNQEC